MTREEYVNKLREQLDEYEVFDKYKHLFIIETKYNKLLVRGYSDIDVQEKLGTINEIFPELQKNKSNDEIKSKDKTKDNKKKKTKPELIQKTNRSLKTKISLFALKFLKIIVLIYIWIFSLFAIFGLGILITLFKFSLEFQFYQKYILFCLIANLIFIGLIFTIKYWIKTVKRKKKNVKLGLIFIIINCFSILFLIIYADNFYEYLKNDGKQSIDRAINKKI